MWYKKILVSITAVAIVTLPLWVAQPAAALFGNSKAAACQGIALDNTDGCTAAKGSLTFNRVLTDILQLLSVAVGITALIMIIIAGLRYITANGDSGNIQSARQTITYALVGLVIVALAQGIVQFVLAKATSTK